MTDLVPFKTNGDTLEKDGKNIYQTNNFFRSLANIMEHPQFREFFDTYIKDSHDIREVIMFMKIYEMVETRDKELNGYQKLSIVRSIITDSKMRSMLAKATIEAEPKELLLDVWQDARSNSQK